MKATISVDLQNAQIGETIIETFKALTEEQRVDLCKQVMLKWLEEPMKIEKAQREAEVLRQLKKSWDHRDKSDEEILKGYDFQNKLRDFKTSREIMVAGIREEIIKNYKEHTEKLVEEDKQLEEIKQSVVAELVKDYPNLVQKAMTMWFTTHLGDIARNMHHEMSKPRSEGPSQHGFY